MNKADGKIRICVLDTETLGQVETEIFDYGYIIADINLDGNYKIIKARSMVASEYINNKILMVNDQFCGTDKYLKYLDGIKSGGIIKHSIEFMLNRLKSDLDGIDYVFAYNCAFDKRQITNQALRYEMENPLDGKQVKDIWAYACQFITCNQDYKDWCDGNNEYTESGIYYKQSAESVYRFISGETDFKEAHMALSDSRIEFEILLECLKRGATLDGEYKVVKYLPNNQTKTDTIVKPDGNELTIEYRRKTNRDGKTYYKM